jgi:hypothetical protein
VYRRATEDIIATSREALARSRKVLERLGGPVEPSPTDLAANQVGERLWSTPCPAASSRARYLIRQRLIFVSESMQRFNRTPVDKPAPRSAQPTANLPPVVSAVAELLPSSRPGLNGPRQFSASV